jgi:hypothetical protein
VTSLGEWTSEWAVNAKGELKGSTKASANFFENGNVQSKLRREHSAVVRL